MELPRFGEHVFTRNEGFNFIKHLPGGRSVNV